MSGRPVNVVAYEVRGRESETGREKRARMGRAALRTKAMGRSDMAGMEGWIDFRIYEVGELEM